MVSFGVTYALRASREKKGHELKLVYPLAHFLPDTRDVLIMQVLLDKIESGCPHQILLIRGKVESLLAAKTYRARLNGISQTLIGP